MILEYLGLAKVFPNPCLCLLFHNIEKGTDWNFIFCVSRARRKAGYLFSFPDTHKDQAQFGSYGRTSHGNNLLKNVMK